MLKVTALAFNAFPVTDKATRERIVLLSTVSPGPFNLVTIMICRLNLGYKRCTATIISIRNLNWMNPNYAMPGSAALSITRGGRAAPPSLGVVVWIKFHLLQGP